MTRSPHSYSFQTVDALRVLGRQLLAERRLRGWTQADLAERAGVSVPTLIAAEKGAATVAIGTVFEVAHLLGIPVVGSASDVVGRELIENRLALLPQRVRATTTEIDDDF